MRVRFHLPDFAGKFRLNLMFAEMLRGCPEYFREGVEIASFYGVFPPSIWNGGRTPYFGTGTRPMRRRLRNGPGSASAAEGALIIRRP